MAVHRCHLLEEMLNEQAKQAEKLRNELREQQEENKLLTHEKESLKATIARMEIEAEVAAAAAAAAATTASAVTPVHSRAATSLKADAEMHVNASTSAESVAVMEELMTKKKRQLDMREATLKDALKKVSADAAKIADQRAALQEQEKVMTAQLTAQFTSLFEEERQRLEDFCADAVTDVQNKYMEWVAQQQVGALERRRRYEQVMEERQQRAAVELAEARAERDALQRALENQRAQLAKLQESGSKERMGRRSDEKRDALSSQCAREVKASLEEAVAGGAALAAAAAKGQFHALQTEPVSTQHLGEEERQTSTDAAAAHAALGPKAQDSMETLVRDMRAKEEEWAKATAAAVATAESAARLAERERLMQEVEKARQQSRCEAEEAVRVATQQRDSAMDALRKQHEHDKEEWLSNMRRLEASQRRKEECRQSQEKSWREEKVALQQKCSALEERLETRKAAAWQLQQQLRDATQELYNLKANTGGKEDAAAEERRTRANAAAMAAQRWASAFLEEAQQGQQLMLEEQARALALLKDEMQKWALANSAAANARDERQREATQRLHTELESARQERDTALEQLGRMRETAADMTTRMSEESAELGTLRGAIQRQQRALAELQEQHQRTVDELYATRAAVVAANTAADVAAPLAESPARAMPAVDGTCYHVLLRLEQCWVLQQANLQSFYSVALYAVVQQEWTQVFESMTSSLAAEAERQRRLSIRNAEALENTTSTIKEVQDDLRLRTQELLQRQVDVEEHERRVQDKKKRVDVLCRSLYTVAQELRKMHLDAAESSTLDEVINSARVMSDSP
ncbi:hypothetical protein LMJF_12_0110 [Leishmania major strain Friedlin]|uniref:Uncharacterized protein n=1 Tax=Leishmania major TaxID=5664 RepID=Q4QGT2_LEIMA|nr:hypothetical protein LMJF_12_0110 [Leishmania major strain Friedlin]CAG9570417.1 hypothetical_protein_-_conserved [Leishmania major strain Friedlin]CAJ02408.1 hypothetical protein LMJF_12_0110 [Leishmania major strain Friedlin]|eukprot:XP_001681616.1 hypothetical protein LMJF_12_0110 [Leishmania major strain Friedlin]